MSQHDEVAGIPDREATIEVLGQWRAYAVDDAYEAHFTPEASVSSVEAAMAAGWKLGYTTIQTLDLSNGYLCLEKPWSAIESSNLI